MTEKKILAVVGATGQQGGGLARAILDDPAGEFSLRALTRDVDSDAARELAARGAEVVQADLDDPESVKKAFQGAYGAFVVTAFWEYNSPEREQAHVRAAVDAATAAGLQHVVWSTLPDTRLHVPIEDGRMPTLHGKYKVPHFDSKGEADKVFTDAGVPTTFLSTTMYFESFLDFFKPTRDDNGTLYITLPMADSPLPGVAREDIGRTAYGIFKQGKDLIGETVNLSGENLTGEEYVAEMGKALGEKVEYRPLTFEQVRALPVPGADDIANMFQYYAEFSDYFAGVRKPEYVRTLNPDLQDFATWLAVHKGQLAE
ncbi:NmrA/HSCARG family protein [Kibdelosporangium philippinense]|uniref:NmrA/HSCARG family protein n=1 Tax=Kibdelosporangium philippinense TaxID=211113 RepID=A0ABS8ZXN6_9PSEU|nr:NmrA/HSCARG family protein [Kibdelosporangium philippinense]MCE7011298.1 NmrA/HSCARG family protein [Kibdelosporangium philippinense]